MKEITFFLILANLGMGGWHIYLANKLADRGDARRSKMSFGMAGVHFLVVVIALALTYPN